MNPLKAHLRSLGILTVVSMLAANAQAFDLKNALVNAETPYSATQTTTSGDNGEDALSMKIYRKGEKTRLDISEEGQDMSIVIRMDEKTHFMLIHNVKMYQEVEAKTLDGYQNNMEFSFTNQKEVGRENVNGYDTTKYTADYKDNDGEVGSGTFWVTDDDIIVRTVMKLQHDGKSEEDITNLTDLKVADQPNELFEIPAGYNTLNLKDLFSEAMEESATSAPASPE